MPCKEWALLLLFLWSGLAAAQNVATMTAAEAEKFIRGSLADGLPVEKLDHVYVLARRHSAVAVPMLVSAIESLQQTGAADNTLLERVGNVLAYIGTGPAVEALVKLNSASGTNRFAAFVERSMEYSLVSGSAYAVLNHLRKQGGDSDNYGRAWLAAHGSSALLRSNLTEAVAEQHCKGVREKCFAAVRNDPLVERLGSKDIQLLENDVRQFVQKPAPPRFDPKAKGTVSDPSPTGVPFGAVATKPAEDLVRSGEAPSGKRSVAPGTPSKPEKAVPAVPERKR